MPSHTHTHTMHINFLLCTHFRLLHTFFYWSNQSCFSPFCWFFFCCSSALGAIRKKIWERGESCLWASKCLYSFWNKQILLQQISVNKTSSFFGKIHTRCIESDKTIVVLVSSSSKQPTISEYEWFFSWAIVDYSSYFIHRFGPNNCVRLFLFNYAAFKYRKKDVYMRTCNAWMNGMGRLGLHIYQIIQIPQSKSIPFKVIYYSCYCA